MMASVAVRAAELLAVVRAAGDDRAGGWAVVAQAPSAPAPAGLPGDGGAPGGGPLTAFAMG